MIGRPAGRIGVASYPQNAPSQGVWRLNEVAYEKAFRSWPPQAGGSENPRFGIFKSEYSGFDLFGLSFPILVFKVLPDRQITTFVQFKITEGVLE
jgi:hypothetical protein